MVDKQEVLVASIIELIVGSLLYFLTQSPLVLITTLGTILAIAIVGIMVKSYYDIYNIVKIRKLINRSKEDWLKHYQESNNIRTLMTRGAGVLGSDKDLMYQCIEKLPGDWKGEIRVLILDPNSRYIQDRANDLGVNTTAIVDQCYTVVRNLKFLKEKYPSRNLKWAFYDCKPFLRFTLFSKCGFFSYGSGKDFKQPSTSKSRLDQDRFTKV